MRRSCPRLFSVLLVAAGLAVVVATGARILAQETQLSDSSCINFERVSDAQISRIVYTRQS